MAFAITANFLLGTYQGSDSGGRPEPYPSPDRLYKACVAAAYNTFDFERQTDDRVLTDEQISENTKNKFIGSGKGSIIGLGAIPPSADKGALDGVSVRGIVSSRVLSFTMLRTFHFGKGVEGDAAIRALIAAALLRAMAGYDENIRLPTGESREHD